MLARARGVLARARGVLARARGVLARSHVRGVLARARVHGVLARPLHKRLHFGSTVSFGLRLNLILFPKRNFGGLVKTETSN